MAVANAWETLFSAQSPEQALWHGLPFSLHAFGGLHFVPPASSAVSDVSVVATAGTGEGTAEAEIDEYERRHWPRNHWPSLSHSTVYAITYDVLNAWVECDGVGRESFRRTDIRWYPSHLEIVWQARQIELSILVALCGEEEALFRIRVINRGSTACHADIVLRGDVNKLNFNANNQSWGKGHGTFRWSEATAVTVEKEIEWGMGLDFFPYFSALKPEDQQFRWKSMYYQMTFALKDEDWRKGEAVSEDGFHTWECRRKVGLKPGGYAEFNVAFVGRWNGGLRPQPGWQEELVKKAKRILKTRSIDGQIQANQDLWRTFFGKVPALRNDWPEDMVRLYYKAWTSVYYNTIPKTDMLLYKSKHRMGVCCKVSPSTMAMCPAAWESSLSALCLSLADPKLACDIIESVYQTTDEDGFVSELLGGWRMTQLAVNEPFTAWVCFKRSGDREFLKRIYPALRKNLFYRAWHPTWKHHGAMMLRNFAYAHISALYAKKIAGILERPADEITRIDEVIDNTRKAVHAYWNEEKGYYRSNFNPVEGGLGGGRFEEGTDAETLIPVFRVSSEDVSRRLLKTICDEFIGENGIIMRKPKTLLSATSGTWNSGSSQSTFTMKESNLMFVYKGLKEKDQALFERVVKGTLANIRKVGDFHECYDQCGKGRHNGPGSIFGAFAVIWGMLLYEGQVDDLYE